MDDWSLLGRIAGLVVLTAAVVTACGVLARAVRDILRLLRRIDQRVQRLSDLTDPDDDGKI